MLGKEEKKKIEFINLFNKKIRVEKKYNNLSEEARQNLCGKLLYKKLEKITKKLIRIKKALKVPNKEKAKQYLENDNSSEKREKH